MTAVPGAGSAQTWTGSAEAYSASFAKLCAGTVEPLLTALGLGSEKVSSFAPRQVLDVGCGTGSSVGAAVARGAGVVGVDPDAQMVAAARLAVPTARFIRAALPTLPFADGTFLAVVANFVVNHLDDPRAGVRELARVTASQGRLGVSIWPATPSAMSRLWADIVAASGAQVPPPSRLQPAMDFPRTAAGLGQLLLDAGLQDVQVGTVDWDLRIDPEELWKGPAAGSATIGRIVTAQTPQLQIRMKHEYDQHVAPLLDGVWLRLPSRALLATATRRN